MSLRPPSNSSGASVSEVLFDALGHEILSEKAAALGRAGARVELCLARLRAHAPEAGTGSDSADDRQARRKGLVKEAADAVYAFFIQRELCGLRRHDAVIRDLAIPREVLVRLGAK
jgi:hypothetical protein